MVDIQDNNAGRSLGLVVSKAKSDSEAANNDEEASVHEQEGSNGSGGH